MSHDRDNLHDLLDHFDPSVRRQVEADIQAAELVVDVLAWLSRPVRRVIRAITPARGSASLASGV